MASKAGMPRSASQASSSSLHCFIGRCGKSLSSSTTVAQFVLEIFRIWLKVSHVWICPKTFSCMRDDKEFTLKVSYCGMDYLLLAPLSSSGKSGHGQSHSGLESFHQLSQYNHQVGQL